MKEGGGVEKLPLLLSLLPFLIRPNPTLCCGHLLRFNALLLFAPFVCVCVLGEV